MIIQVGKGSFQRDVLLICKTRHNLITTVTGRLLYVRCPQAVVQMNYACTCDAIYWQLCALGKGHLGVRMVSVELAKGTGQYSMVRYVYKEWLVHAHLQFQSYVNTTTVSLSIHFYGHVYVYMFTTQM